MFFFARTAARMTSPCFKPRAALRKSSCRRIVIQRVVFAAEDARRFVFNERKDPTRPQANCEYRPADNRRNDALESTAVYREFGFENRMLMVEDRAAPSGDFAEGAGGLRCRDFAKPDETFADAFHPEGAVRIQKDIFGSIIAQESQDLITQFALQLSFEPVLMLIMDDSKATHFSSSLQTPDGVQSRPLSTK